MVVLVLFGALIFVTSRIFQFLVFFLIAFSALDIDDRSLLNFSYRTLLILYIAVFFLCAIGVLENSVTYRYVNDGKPRYTLGFYHSNVPPLIFLYLLSYRILLKREQFSWCGIGFSIIISIILYVICNSRISFLLTLVLMLTVAMVKLLGTGSKMYAPIYTVSRYIVLFGVILSTLCFTMLKESNWIQYIDKILSYRFEASARKYTLHGLHLIAVVDTDTFFSDGIILDNVYIFLALRYGIVVAVLFSLLFWYFAKKRGNDIYIAIVLIIIATTNFIDNDLLDYSCLPFMIIALKQWMTSSRTHIRNLGISGVNS